MGRGIGPQAWDMVSLHLKTWMSSLGPISLEEYWAGLPVFIIEIYDFSLDALSFSSSIYIFVG